MRWKFCTYVHEKKSLDNQRQIIFGCNARNILEIFVHTDRQEYETELLHVVVSYNFNGFI